MSRNEQWIATQLAKFPKGVFPGGKKRKIVKRFEQFFCRQIKTKKRGDWTHEIKQTFEIYKAGGGTGWGEGRGGAGGSLAENYKKIVQLLFARKGMKSSKWQQAAGSSRSRRFLSQFFTTISRALLWRLSNKFKRYMRTDFNAIIDAPTHIDTDRERQRQTLCHIVWQHDATAERAACNYSLPSGVARLFTFFCPFSIANWPSSQYSQQQSMGNLQHAACNMQQAVSLAATTFNAECRTPKFSHLVTFMLSDFHWSPCTAQHQTASRKSSKNRKTKKKTQK